MPLRDTLDTFPRLPLGVFPTPLEHLPRLSVALRRPVYLKRDDLLGPGLGGNKTRKLEYLMAEAVACGARRVVTFGGVQSNSARLTAAAARICGMEPHLFLFGRHPRRLTGNLLVNQALGAHMHFLPLPESREPGRTIEQAIRLVRVLARLWVGPHYFVPIGGHAWRGCLGYVRGALELDEQARSLGLGDARLVLGVGTGGTLAGLLAGLALTGSPLHPLGIDVSNSWKQVVHSVAALATETCAGLGAPRHFAPADVPLVERAYVGRRYGEPSDAGQAAMRRLALLEGVVLDPVYTAKAFAGLLDLAERGELGHGTPIIFLHTGGSPGFFV